MYKPKYKLADVIDFGKHRGEKMVWIIKNDPHYIEWCIINVNQFVLSEEAKELFDIVIQTEYELARDDYDDYTWHDAYGTFLYGKND